MTTNATRAATAANMTEAEELARAFASRWDTPEVRRGIELAEAGRIAWDGLAGVFARAFAQAEASVTTTRTRVEYQPGRRYPYVPVCDCGAEFRGYVAEHAAQIMVDDHCCDANHG